MVEEEHTRSSKRWDEVPIKFILFEMSPTQHSDVCHRTAMADTHIYPRALRRERVGPREPPTMEHSLREPVVVTIHRLCRALSIAGNHVLWGLSHSEKLHRVKHRLGFFFCFVIFSRYKSTCSFLPKTNVCSFYFVFISFFSPPSGPVLT